MATRYGIKTIKARIRMTALFQQIMGSNSSLTLLCQKLWDRYLASCKTPFCLEMSHQFRKLTEDFWWHTRWAMSSEYSPTAPWYLLVQDFEYGLDLFTTSNKCSIGFRSGERGDNILCQNCPEIILDTYHTVYYSAGISHWCGIHEVHKQSPLSGKQWSSIKNVFRRTSVLDSALWTTGVHGLICSVSYPNLTNSKEYASLFTIPIL